MTRRRAFTLAELRRLARLATETGATVEATYGDLTVRIAPKDATLPAIGPSAREAEECDKAFGVGG